MSITDELRHNIKGAEQLYGRECTRLTAIADRIDAAVEGMVELPKDADGVPWNVGDRDEDGNEVFELVLNSDGWYLINGTKSVDKADSIRHYHDSTIEDVLREFAEGWSFACRIGKEDSYMAQFVPKLCGRRVEQ